MVKLLKFNNLSIYPNTFFKMNYQNQNLPIVSIIGRTNVGKSTLFNLLVKNKAIISRIAGTTRDTNYQSTEWLGKKFIVVDTGGLETLYTNKKSAEIDQKIAEKTIKSIQNSDLILFIVDAKTGIMPQDKEFAEFIKKNKLNHILVVNKCDNKKISQNASEFYKLGIKDIALASAISGSRVGDLLDLVLKKIPKKSFSKKKEPKTLTAPPIKLAFIGKTNVGKSSLINALLNEEKIIVSDAEHTTRDMQIIPFKYQDYDFKLIDTAGIRKKRTKIKKDELELKSVQQTKKAIKDADIIILITDVSKNLSVADLKFAKLIKGAKKGLIIVANKWDLIKDKDTKIYDEYLLYYKKTIPYLMWAKFIPTSATKNIKTTHILDEALEINQKFSLKIEKQTLDNFLQEILRIHKPTIGRGTRRPKIYEIKQVDTKPQTFEVLIGAKTSLNNSYLKFIENKIRTKFKLRGIPVVAYVRKLKNII